MSQVSSVHSHAQEEMKKLNNKWKKKEIRSKRENQEEKEKVKYTWEFDFENCSFFRVN